MAVRLSNGLFLEVLTSLPVQGLPIEVDIYDGDNPATMLATMEGAREVGWTDPFGDVGSGSFLLSVDDPKATALLLQSGNLVKIKLAGSYVYSFWIENPKVVVASVDGKAGKHWTLGGRGLEAYLERGGVYPVGWPTVTATEHVFTGATFGTILGDMIDLAVARGAMPDLTYDFTDTLDSHGEAWDQAINLTVRAGTSILDLWRQLIGLGMESRMTTDLKLQAFDMSRHKEQAVIFREGYHLRGEVVRELQDASLRSRVLVSGANGRSVEASDPLLEAIPRIGRREGFVDFSSSSDPTTLQVVANKFLETFTDLTEAISLPVSHGPEAEGQYEPYITYRNGDWVALDVPGFYERQPFRVASISVAMIGGGGYAVDLDLNSVAVEHIVTLKRMIDALSGGSSGAGTAGSGSVSGIVGPSGGGGGSGSGRVAVAFGDSPGYLADKIETDATLTKALVGETGSQRVRLSVAPIGPIVLDTLADVDTVTVAPTNGQALVYDLASGLWKPGTISGGGGGGSAVNDRRWAIGPAEVVIDEFNDSLLNAAWVAATHTSYPAGAKPSYVESADVLSVKYGVASGVGGSTPDGATGRHAGLVRPLSDIGGAMANGDAFVTAFTVHVRGANYRMSGLVLSTSGASGAGRQLYVRWWNNNVANALVSIRDLTSWGGDTKVGADYSYMAGLIYLRIVRLSASTWRYDVSSDGVQWILGDSASNWAFEPTHVGFAESNWNTATPSVTSYEFLRRVAGIA